MTGRSVGLILAIELVRPLDTVMMKSTFHVKTSTTLWSAVVYEITLVESVDPSSTRSPCSPAVRSTQTPCSQAPTTELATRSTLKAILHP
jgi:hypothetical protein